MDAISTSYSDFKFSKIYQVYAVLLPVVVCILFYFYQREAYDLSLCDIRQMAGRLFSVLVTCVITDAVGQTSSGVVFQTEKK
uniref:Uncharacterized protein n=1 Tax=Solanum lycopersicum TaxID=4081 RepID=K4CDT0_SOLLC